MGSSTPRRTPTPRKSTLAKPPRKKKARLRLIGVNVEPIMVWDDGDTLIPVESPVTRISAEEWPTFSNVRFPKDVAAAERDYNAVQAEPAVPVEPSS